MNPTPLEIEDALIKLWQGFSSPIGSGWKEFLSDAIPFFDVFYGWAMALAARDSSILRETLKFPIGDIIKFCVITLIFILITEILENFLPVVVKAKWLRLVCAILASVINATLNYNATQIMKYGGNEVMASFLSIAGKSVLVIGLLIGCVLIFIKKLSAGMRLSKLIIKAGVEILEKSIELAVLYVTAVFVMLIIEIPFSNMAQSAMIGAILMLVGGLIALSVLLYIAERILDLINT